MTLRDALPRAWYSDARWLRWLQPVSQLYGALARRRRQAWQGGNKTPYRAALPVVVIGNIAVGGTGKTPLTLALCRYLQARGLKPAIVSRGYGGEAPLYPLYVTRDTPLAHCGDEALLYARSTEVPVVVDPNRARAVARLECDHAPDLVLCDDGLQHYALARDIELVVVDGSRGFGNGLLLPAGPLREPVSRLAEVDYVVVNADAGLPLPPDSAPRVAMQLVPELLENLASGECLDSATWLARYGASVPQVHAVAGIGNPGRFFRTLTDLGFAIMAHPFPDHHRFQASDLAFADALPIVMTEKDAVKCLPFADARHWCLNVRAQLPEAFLQALAQRIQALCVQHTVAL